PDVFHHCRLRAPMVFNFGCIQADPLRQLLWLRQLLAKGIRPTWLVVGVMPPFLHQDPDCVAENWRQTMDLWTWYDFLILRRYLPRPDLLYCAWGRRTWRRALPTGAAS